MNNDTIADLWIGAFRYYCGRETISVHSFCDGLIKEYVNLPRQARECIYRDLGRAFEDDNRDRANGREVKTLGHDMDRAKWEDVARHIGVNANECMLIAREMIECTDVKVKK